MPASQQSLWVPPDGFERMMVMVAERSAEVASERAADSAVKSTFMHLGIDLEDKDRVKRIRTGVAEMERRIERREGSGHAWRNGIISGACAIGVSSLIWLFSLLGKHVNILGGVS